MSVPTLPSTDPGTQLLDGLDALVRRHRALRGGGDRLQVGRDGLLDAGDLHQPLRVRAEHRPEGTEPGDQRLGERLGVAAGDRAEEQQFKQFVIGQRLWARIHEAGAQPVAVAGMGRGGFFRFDGLAGEHVGRTRELAQKDLPFVVVVGHPQPRRGLMPLAAT